MRTRAEILAPRVAPLEQPIPLSILRDMLGAEAAIEEDAPRFLTPLRIQKIGETWDGRATWKLIRPLVYRSAILRELGVDPVVTVPEGFETDLTSALRLPLVFLFAGDTAHAPAAIHDKLYRDKPYPRDVADALFNEGMGVHQPELGIFAVPAWRRWLMVGSLRAMGWYAWNRYVVQPVRRMMAR